MTYFLLALAMLAAGWLALLLLDSMIRRPVLVAAIVLTLVILEELISQSLVSVELGEFRISILDIGFGMVAFAGLLRFFRFGGAKPGQLSIIVLGVMSLLSVVLGVAYIDIATAINEFRSYLGFVGVALYFGTVVGDRATREGMARAWMWGGLGMSAVVLLRWTARLTSIDIGVLDATYDATIRAISGPSTFFIASAALILILPGLEAWSERPRLERYAGLYLLLLTVILNRRTVWVTIIVAFAVLVMRNPRVGRRLAVAAIAGSVLLIAAIPLFASEDSSDATTAQSVTDTGTLTWRVEGWAELISSGPNDPPEYIIGQPFGSGYDRSIGGIDTDVNPHSFYVQTFLRTGLVGLAALLATLWFAFVASTGPGPPESGALRREHLLVLTTVLAVWLVVWPPGTEQAIILGLAVGCGPTLLRRDIPFSESTSTQRRFSRV